MTAPAHLERRTGRAPKFTERYIYACLDSHPTVIRNTPACDGLPEEL